MVLRPRTWRNLNNSGWNRHTTDAWGGSWVCGFQTSTVCSTSGKPAKSSRWPLCLHNDGCAGWGTWLECQRPGIPMLRSMRSWRALLLVVASRHSLSGQLSAKTSRQLAYHTRWGVVCVGKGQITLAPVGAGHAIYIGDPHTGTHTAGPGMQTLRGAAICGLARMFGWHHLVLPASHSAHGQNR
jgi:hypothetical protein